MIIWKFHHNDAKTTVMANNYELTLAATDLWVAMHGRKIVAQIEEIHQPDGIAAHIIYGKRPQFLYSWYRDKSSEPKPSIDESKKIVEDRYAKYLEKMIR